MTLSSSEVKAVHRQLHELRAEMLGLEQSWAERLEQGRDPDSLRNLVHYLVLRRHDLHQLHQNLDELGACSLRRVQAHALASLEAVLELLERGRGLGPGLHATPGLIGVRAARARTELNAERALGPRRPARSARIMVTLPTEAAVDRKLLPALLQAGTDLVRINCAHDDPEVWAKMLENLRRARARTGLTCNVEMELGGPKIRILEAPKSPFHSGDEILLCPADSHSPKKNVPVVTCSLTELPRAEPGHRVFFDDGKLEALVEEKVDSGLKLRIAQTVKAKARLKPDNGVNFPDSELSLPALTSQDREHLRFVAEHADLVGFSFVRHTNDLAEFDQALVSLGAEQLPILLKIETREGFSRLPALLIAAPRARPLAVMIARGDLALNLGYERLAELQAEILWFCQAAHIPVIWATQVLEQLTKRGLPSRAEITDAATAEHADCVMLNKGAHIVDAVSLLDSLLHRMHEHQQATRPTPSSAGAIGGLEAFDQLG